MTRWRVLTLLLCASGCVTTERDRTVERARGLVQNAQTRRGSLRLVCAPADAVVGVDGVEMGRCSDFSGRPEGIRLGEGMHRVDVAKEGFWPYQTYLQPSGARASLNLTLRPLNDPNGASQ